MTHEVVQQQLESNRSRRWIHRLAWLLAALTFPLIWVGGLVTSYEAGMAVPDWPSTFGYNLLLYPLDTWFLGPWDIFVEHGHRLLATLVGLVTLVLLGMIWGGRSPRSWRSLSVLLLLGVVGQGVLGGLRVLQASTQIAQIHAVTGPLFFTLAVIMVWVTRPSVPRTTIGDDAGGVTPRLRSLACGLALLVLGQLVLGSFLRHVTAATSRTTFQAAVLLHVGGAVAAVGYAWYQAVCVCRSNLPLRWYRTHVLSLAALLSAQLMLGMLTWSLKYGVPTWIAGQDVPLVIVAESLLQTSIITAHVALGALILALTSLWSVRVLAAPASRTRSVTQTAVRPATWTVEAAQ